MADLVQVAQGGGGGAAVADGVVVDPNKTAEQYIKDVESLYIVPALIREKYSDLVKLIYETESMDQEEREYWLQIMPIMTDPQIEKFRGILVNEKEQLVKLDQQYKSKMSSIKGTPVKPIDEAAVKKKMADIKAKEEAHEAEEKVAEEELLKQFEDLDKPET